jgi:integrase
VVGASNERLGGWGEVVQYTAARIGEVFGVPVHDIDRDAWTWEGCRQTAPAQGGLIDKGTMGKRHRTVPLIREIRHLVAGRLDAARRDPARLFTGPRGGRITTAVLPDATLWESSRRCRHSVAAGGIALVLAP